MKKGKCGMIVNETTPHHRQNDIEVKNYRSPSDFNNKPNTQSKTEYHELKNVRPYLNHDKQ